MLKCIQMEVNMKKDDNMDYLFKAMLSLKTVDECYAFFEDLCTPQLL